MLLVLRYVGKVKVRADLVKQGIKKSKFYLVSREICTYPVRVVDKGIADTVCLRTLVLNETPNF
jgi:hypothetical protein